MNNDDIKSFCNAMNGVIKRLVGNTLCTAESLLEEVKRSSERYRELEDSYKEEKKGTEYLKYCNYLLELDLIRNGLSELSLFDPKETEVIDQDQE